MPTELIDFLFFVFFFWLVYDSYRLYLRVSRGQWTVINLMLNVFFLGAMTLTILLGLKKL